MGSMKYLHMRFVFGGPVMPCKLHNACLMKNHEALRPCCHYLVLAQRGERTQILSCRLFQVHLIGESSVECD